MLRKPQKRAARAGALARSEIHPSRHDDAGIVQSEMRKRALSRLKADRKAIQETKAARKNAGTFPLERDEAEAIASRYFIEQGETWMRSVGKLMGQTYAETRHYYMRALPELRAAEEETSDGIEIDGILLQELGDDPALSI